MSRSKHPGYSSYSIFYDKAINNNLQCPELDETLLCCTQDLLLSTRAIQRLWQRQELKVQNKQHEYDAEFLHSQSLA